MNAHRLAALFAAVVLSSCLAVDGWDEVKEPYTSDVIATGRTLYVERNGKQPVTIHAPVWEESDGRAYLAGTVREEPDRAIDLPRLWLVELVHFGPISGPGRVAVDEVDRLRVEPEPES